MKCVLYLNLHGEYLEQIAAGTKRIEYGKRTAHTNLSSGQGPVFSRPPDRPEDGQSKRDSLLDFG